MILAPGADSDYARGELVRLCAPQVVAGLGPRRPRRAARGEETMNDVSRRQWLRTAGTLGVAAAAAGTATAQSRPSADELGREVRGGGLMDEPCRWHERSRVLSLNPP